MVVTFRTLEHSEKLLIARRVVTVSPSLESMVPLLGNGRRDPEGIVCVRGRRGQTV